MFFRKYRSAFSEHGTQFLTCFKNQSLCTKVDVSRVANGLKKLKSSLLAHSLRKFSWDEGKKMRESLNRKDTKHLLYASCWPVELLARCLAVLPKQELSESLYIPLC